MIRRLTRLFTCASLLIAIALPASAAAKPLLMDDIVQLRRQRTSYDDIVKKAKMDGVGFDIDKKAESRLRIMRFKPLQIDAIKTAREATLNPPAPDAPGQPGAPDADAAKAAADNAMAKEAMAKAPMGPRKPGPWHDSINDLIKAINDASNADLIMQPMRTITLSAKKTYATRYGKDVDKVEKWLKATFPDPIGKGTDKRSAHIVILETRYDYEKWVKAMFKVYAARGITVGGQDPMGMLLRANSFLMPTHSVMCLETLPDETLRRHAIGYYVGHMTMRQITEGRAPDAMTTGFGNTTETYLMGQPITTVFSYEERKMDRSGNRWKRIVYDRMAKKEAGSLSAIFKYSTVDMKEAHYAEAWTFMSTLTTAPDKFADWVKRVRDMQLVREALAKAFGHDENTLTKGWYKWVEQN